MGSLMTGQSENRVDAMPRGAASRFRQDEVLTVLRSRVDELLRIHCRESSFGEKIGVGERNRFELDHRPRDDRATIPRMISSRMGPLEFDGRATEPYGARVVYRRAHLEQHRALHDKLRGSGSVYLTEAIVDQFDMLLRLQKIFWTNSSLRINHGDHRIKFLDRPDPLECLI